MTFPRVCVVAVLTVVVFGLLTWILREASSADDNVKVQCTAEGACVDQLSGPIVVVRRL